MFAEAEAGISNIKNLDQPADRGGVEGFRAAVEFLPALTVTLRLSQAGAGPEVSLTLRRAEAERLALLLLKTVLDLRQSE